MNNNKLNLLWLLIAFAAGAIVYHIFSNQQRLNYAVVEQDSRIAKLEARDMQIEAQKANRHWVRYVLLPFTWIVGKLIVHW